MMQQESEEIPSRWTKDGGNANLRNIDINNSS